MISFESASQWRLEGCVVFHISHSDEILGGYWKGKEVREGRVLYLHVELDLRCLVYLGPFDNLWFLKLSFEPVVSSLSTNYSTELSLAIMLFMIFMRSNSKSSGFGDLGDCFLFFTNDLFLGGDLFLREKFDIESWQVYFL